jgi:adenine/guanine phosphoribosyltransferase-like PRPP-binding protein
VLVDDVMTTGATASACALALKRAGARRVTLLALARADRRFGADAPVLKKGVGKSER